MSNSSYVNNHYLPNCIAKIICHGKDNDLIDSKSDEQLAAELLSDFTSLFSALHPGTSSLKLRNMLVDELHLMFRAGKIKEVSARESSSEIKSGVGGMIATQSIIAEKKALIVNECVSTISAKLK